MSQVEDNNPAYELANTDNLSIDRNPNQIENYDYMWNQDDYDYMEQYNKLLACFQSAHVLICQHTTLHQKPSGHCMFEKSSTIFNSLFALQFALFHLTLKTGHGIYVWTILIIIKSEEEKN